MARGGSVWMATWAALLLMATSNAMAQFNDSLLCDGNGDDGFVSMCPPTDLFTASSCGDAMSLEAVCDDEDKLSSMEGGLRGAPAGQFEYYDFTLYWAPTYCTGTSNDSNSDDITVSSLCPPNIAKGYPLDFLAIQPRLSFNAWPEYCASSMGNFSMCAENAGMSKEECKKAMEGGDDDLLCGEECFIPEKTVKNMNKTRTWGQYAPSYTAAWDANNVGNKAWMAYGSCSGEDSKTLFTSAVDVTKLVVNGPGSVFGLGLGSELNMSIIEQAFPNNTATFGCKSCSLATVNMCLERKEDGSPGFAVPCPEGHMDGLHLLQTEDCSSCEAIKIPAFEGQNVTAQLQEKLDDTWQNFQVAVSNATSNAKSRWSTLQDQLTNATQGIADNFSNITSAQDLGEAAKGSFNDVKDIANDIGSAAKEGFNELKDGVQNIFG